MGYFKLKSGAFTTGEGKDLKPITREEMKARADKLRQMADALEQRSQEGQQASQQDQTGKEWQQAAQEHGQTPTVQTDDPMRPGRSTPGVPMQGPGQAPVPPQQQRERDLQQAKDLEQKGRAEQEQSKADQLAQQREEDVKLERATVEQLRAVAEEEEVDVPKNASRAQLLQAIRQNRK
jgi:hypothetical protein